MMLIKGLGHTLGHPFLPVQREQTAVPSPRDPKGAPRRGSWRFPPQSAQQSLRSPQLWHKAHGSRSPAGNGLSHVFPDAFDISGNERHSPGLWGDADWGSIPSAGRWPQEGGTNLGTEGERPPGDGSGVSVQGQEGRGTRSPPRAQRGRGPGKPGARPQVLSAEPLLCTKDP